MVADEKGLTEYVQGRLRQRVTWEKIRGMNVLQTKALSIRESNPVGISLQDEIRIFTFHGRGIIIRIGGMNQEEGQAEAILKIEQEWRRRSPQAAERHDEHVAEQARTRWKSQVMVAIIFGLICGLMGFMLDKGPVFELFPDPWVRAIAFVFIVPLVVGVSLLGGIALIVGVLRLFRCLRA